MENTLQSEKTAELVMALIKASASMKPAKKDSENPFFHSKYADLSAITEASKESLVQNGLVVTQSTTIDGGQCVLVTTIHHQTGQWLRGFYPVTAIKADPQSMGSAVTYARRYALSAILGIVSEDDDGEQAMGRKNGGFVSAPYIAPPLVEDERRAVPADPSDWRNIEIHFGKSKGKSLGSLSPSSLKWWVNEWQPTPFRGKIDPQNTILREALDQVTAVTAKEEELA